MSDEELFDRGLDNEVFGQWRVLTTNNIAAEGLRNRVGKQCGDLFHGVRGAIETANYILSYLFRKADRTSQKNDRPSLQKSRWRWRSLCLSRKPLREENRVSPSNRTDDRKPLVLTYRR